MDISGNWPLVLLAGMCPGPFAVDNRGKGGGKRG